MVFQDPYAAINPAYRVSHGIMRAIKIPDAQGPQGLMGLTGPQDPQGTQGSSGHEWDGI